MKNLIIFCLLLSIVLISRADEKSKKIKFYRNPMNPSITSPVFMKDDMGMDYIPVYEEEADKTDQQIKGRSSFKLSDEEANNVSLKPALVKIQAIHDYIPSSGRAVSTNTVVLQVHEADIVNVKVGLKVELRSPSAAESFDAKISNIDSILDPMTRSVRVTASLTKAATSLRPESSVLAKIYSPERHGILVPINSVIRTGDSNIVYVIKDKRIEARKVSLGAKIEDSLEILDGLSEGEMINIHANFLLDSEARIRGAND